MEHWREQKSGPKWKFYLLFTIAWAVVCFLVLFFLTKLVTSLWKTGGPNLAYIFILISFLIGFFATHLTYVINEKKYHKIIDRERKKMN
jgi:uncharacterized membrane protein